MYEIFQNFSENLTVISSASTLLNKQSEHIRNVEVKAELNDREVLLVLNNLAIKRMAGTD